MTPEEVRKDMEERRRYLWPEPAPRPQHNNPWYKVMRVSALELSGRPPFVRWQTALVVGLALVLSGCATCDRHPRACAAAIAVVATSVSLSVTHSLHHDRVAPPAPANPCAPNPRLCET